MSHCRCLGAISRLGFHAKLMSDSSRILSIHIHLHSQVFFSHIYIKPKYRLFFQARKGKDFHRDIYKVATTVRPLSRSFFYFLFLFPESDANIQIQIYRKIEERKSDIQPQVSSFQNVAHRFLLIFPS